MTTLVPLPAYTQEEITQLYPKGLELQLVQVLLRHGERSPTSARFQNAGLSPYWPYCSAARQLSSVIKTSNTATWSNLQWRRRLETFGVGDDAILAKGPRGEEDGVCVLGELTDTGRETTLALGQRLRRLYVDQLGFMPKLIGDADMIYLRATPMPRALESVQQAFWGMYPLTARTATFPPPTIVTRTAQEETLYPNEAFCRRFSQLVLAYGRRTADRWNDTPDVKYVSSLLSKWMPEQAAVKVDAHPRLSGVMDTINSTLAHGPETRLPNAFYDPKARAIIDRIGVEEWFSGYAESLEYRTVGIGALAGDIAARMVSSANNNSTDGITEIGDLGTGRGGEKSIKFALSGCHDTTLAALLSSLGCFKGQSWPPYTSHIAFELFRQKSNDSSSVPVRQTTQSTWSKLSHTLTGTPASDANTSARSRFDDMATAEREKLDHHYVRVRYNDRVMIIPGCKTAGNHLEGDESLCTLTAFKTIVDKYTPRNWRESCGLNLDKAEIPAEIEPAGY